MPRALVISGGGAKGAFAVGALKRLGRVDANLDFDIVAGTSIGALIAPFVVTKDIAMLEELFTTLETRQVVRRQTSVLDMHNKGYIYSSRELRKRVEENLTPERAATVLDSATTTSFFATVCLQTGRVSHFHAGRDPTATPDAKYDMIPAADRSQLINAIMASANMPVLMGPTVKRDDRQYVDGGVRAYAPFEVALEQGVTEVWAILHSSPPDARPTEDRHFRKLTSVAMRTISLLTQDVGDNDYDLAILKMQAKGIPTDKILRPPDDIEERFGIKALEFDPGAMRELVDYGEEVAEQAGW